MSNNYQRVLSFYFSLIYNMGTRCVKQNWYNLYVRCSSNKNLITFKIVEMDSRSFLGRSKINSKLTTGLRYNK